MKTNKRSKTTVIYLPNSMDKYIDYLNESGYISHPSEEISTLIHSETNFEKCNNCYGSGRIYNIEEYSFADSMFYADTTGHVKYNFGDRRVEDCNVCNGHGVRRVTKYYLDNNIRIFGK